MIEPVYELITEQYDDELDEYILVRYCYLCDHEDWSGDQFPFAVEHGEGLCV